MAETSLVVQTFVVVALTKDGHAHAHSNHATDQEAQDAANSAQVRYKSLTFAVVPVRFHVNISAGAV